MKREDDYGYWKVCDSFLRVESECAREKDERDVEEYDEEDVV